MDIHPLLKQIEAWPLSASIRNSLTAFPTLESVHVIALSLVFGTIVIVDLRILGVASRQRVYRRVAGELLRWTWAAFALAALTGTLMFITNPVTYYETLSFRIKMGLLVAAGLNMVIFHLTASREMETWEDARPSPPAAKVAAILSMCIWLGVIAAGRVVGFAITGGAQGKEPPPSDVNFDDFLSGGGPPPPGSDAPPPPPPQAVPAPPNS